MEDNQQHKDAEKRTMGTIEVRESEGDDMTLEGRSLPVDVEVVYLAPEAWAELGVEGGLDDLPLVERAAREHEAGQTDLFRVEHRLRTKDGRWMWVLNWGRVTERDKNGEPVRALGFHLDITDRKRSEAPTGAISGS